MPLTHAQIMASLDPSDPATITRLIEHHRAAFGHARMEADDAEAPGGDESQEVTTEDLQAVLDELKLTPGQLKGRLEASRKWERRAKDDDKVSRTDYDKVREENEKLRQQTLTDAEKAVEAARNEGIADGRREAAENVASTMFRTVLADRGKSTDAIDTLAAAFAPAQVLTDSGELDTAKLTAVIDVLAPKGEERNEWPDTGQGNRQAPNGSSVANGRALYAARKQK